MEETSSKSKLILDVYDRPKIGQWIILALQHVFAMFGATILVPILVNTAAGTEVLSIPVALVTSGIGTLIYILCTKAKSPVYLGSSFAFIVPITAAYLKSGIAGAMTGIMVVGLIYVIVAIIIKIIGKNWINKILPPVVIGPMIMIIGLGLAPSAITQIGLSSESTLEWKSIVVALITFLTTAIVMVKGKGFLKIIPFLVGIVVGYISAICFGLVNFDSVISSTFFNVPNFVIPFIHYTPTFSAILTIAPIALVTMAEHIGDHTALSTITGKDLLKDPGLDRTLMGDGIATFVAGMLGGPANTTYGENTSVVGMTKIASVWVIGLAAIFAIILGFLGKFTAVVSSIPNCVLGGVSLLLYGFISVNGLKVLIENKTDFNKNKNVIVASSMLVLGLGGAAVSFVSGDFSLSISGMSLAAIVGILLDLLLPNETNTQDTTDNTNIAETIDTTPAEKETKKFQSVIELNHPLIEHKLGILRDKNTGTKEFRELAGEIGMFLCYKAMEDIQLEKTEIETPLCKLKTGKLNEDNYAFVPILRAGMGMLDGVINVIPNAKIGHIGMYRDEKNNHKPVNYFFKVPKNIENKEVILLDPMLATGGSAIDAIDLLKEKNVKKIKFLCIIAAPEGLKKVQEKHPDVPIYCAKIDDHLNKDAYIVPGLGDAGDRIYGTK